MILGSLIAFAVAVGAEFMAENGMSGIDWEASWAESSTAMAIALVVAAVLALVVILAFRMRSGRKAEKGEA